jgi:hypothetical protein
MAQVVQGYIAKLADKKRIRILGNNAKLAPMCRRVFSQVNIVGV